MRNANDKVLVGGRVTALGAPAGAVTQKKPIPFNCELVSIAFALSAPPSLPATLEVYVNDVDTGIVFNYPASGTSHTLYPDARVYLNEGDVLHLRSGGESVSSPAADVSYVLRNNGNEQIMNGDTITAMQTATTQSELKVVPYDCEILGLAVGLSANLSTPTTLEVFLDQVTTGIDFTAPSGTTTPGLLRPATKVFAKKGVTLNVKTGGETTGTPIGFFTWLLRPMQSIPLGRYFLEIPGTFNLTAASDSEGVVAPDKADVVEMVLRPFGAVAASPANGCFLGLKLNEEASATGVQYHLEEGATAPALLPVLNRAHEYVEPADRIRINLLGENIGSAGTVGTLILDSVGDTAR